MIYIINKRADSGYYNIGVLTDETTAFMWAWKQAFQHFNEYYIEVWDGSNQYCTTYLVDLYGLCRTYALEVLIELRNAVKNNCFPDILREFILYKPY